MNILNKREGRGSEALKTIEEHGSVGLGMVRLIHSREVSLALDLQRSEPW